MTFEFDDECTVFEYAFKASESSMLYVKVVVWLRASVRELSRGAADSKAKSMWVLSANNFCVVRPSRSWFHVVVWFNPSVIVANEPQVHHVNCVLRPSGSICDETCCMLS